MNCPLCGDPTYFSGHAHDDCPGNGEACQDCGWGCDLDFINDGQCAQLEALETDDEDDEKMENA
jgi:hypothetical protein